MTTLQEFQILFSGKKFNARSGDTLARVLWRAGVKTLGQSAKHARPRGLRWFDRPCDVAVTVAGRPGSFDPVQLVLSPGMDISVAPEAGAPQIAPGNDLSTGACVVGAGPAGLAAALTLARAGVTATIIEQEETLGGHLRWTRNPALIQWLHETLEELGGAGVQFLTGTRADAPGDTGWAVTTTAADQKTKFKIDAPLSIFAAGALERMIAFANNDLPGIMTADALLRLVAMGDFQPGQRVALFTNNDAAYQCLGPLSAAGAKITAVIDVRTGRAKLAGFPDFDGAVSGASGTRSLQQITVTHGRKKTTLDCDVLAVSGGWSPAIAPLMPPPARPLWNPMIEAWLSPPGTWPGIEVAGAAGGSFGARAAMKSGYFRARRALAQLDKTPVPVAFPDIAENDPQTAPFWQVAGGENSYLDFTRDITLQEKSAASANETPDDIARRYLANPTLR